MAIVGVVFWVIIILIYTISQTFKYFYFRFLIFVFYYNEGKRPPVVFTCVVFLVGVRVGVSFCCFSVYCLFSYFVFVVFAGVVFVVGVFAVVVPRWGCRVVVSCFKFSFLCLFVVVVVGSGSGCSYCCCARGG